ncbi:MAG: hypothetical protein ACE363_04990 [Alphaproteobacteria bacterium]
MAADLENISLQDLHKMIKDSEALLIDLRQELARRIEAAEHQEIDRLEVHMQDTGHRLHHLRDFLTALLADLRGTR